jgi:hypothetical protein
MPALTIRAEVNWLPDWAPSHLHAHYTALVDNGDEDFDPQVIKCHCDQCNTDWEGRCLSGRARQHIQRFCRQHLHTDVMTRQP